MEEKKNAAREKPRAEKPRVESILVSKMVLKSMLRALGLELVFKKHHVFDLFWRMQGKDGRNIGLTTQYHRFITGWSSLQSLVDDILLRGTSFVAYDRGSIAKIAENPYMGCKMVEEVKIVRDLKMG